MRVIVVLGSLRPYSLFPGCLLACVLTPFSAFAWVVFIPPSLPSFNLDHCLCILVHVLSCFWAEDYQSSLDIV